jgi:hypothetical protein
MLKEELVEGYVRGDITRRTFVRRLTATGVGLAAALSYAELIRPQDAQAAAGEDDYYESRGDYYESRMPPDVTTDGVVDIGATGATARAQVDPNLQDTTVTFEVGPRGGPYATSASKVESGDVDRLVTIPLTGLAPSTTYVVRAIAVNRSGRSEGEFVAFSTGAQQQTQPPVAYQAPPPQPPVSPPQDRRGPFVNPKRTTLALKQVLRSGVIPIEVTADEDASADVVASLTQPVTGVRAAARRTRKVKVASTRASVRGGRSTTLKLKLTRAGRKALKQRKAATLQVEITATDRSRNRSLLRTSVRLK